MRPSPWTGLLLIGLSGCSGGSSDALPTPSTSVAGVPTISPSALPTTASVPTRAPTATDVPITGPTPPPLETAPPPGAPPCKASALTVTDADMLVTQKAREEVFVVRTTGPDCGLSGFPSVTLKGAGPVTYRRDGSKPTTLSLSKGTTVSFSLTSARTGSCADAVSISVVLPGTGAALSTSTTARVCNGAVTVSPLRRLNADS